MPIELVPNHLHCCVNEQGIICLATIDSFDWDELAPKLDMFSINHARELGLSRDEVTDCQALFIGSSAFMLLRRLFDLEDNDEPVRWSEIEQLCEENGLNVQVCHSGEKGTIYRITHPG